MNPKNKLYVFSELSRPLPKGALSIIRIDNKVVEIVMILQREYGVVLDGHEWRYFIVQYHPAPDDELGQLKVVNKRWVTEVFFTIPKARFQLLKRDRKCLQ